MYGQANDDATSHPQATTAQHNQPATTVGLHNQPATDSNTSEQHNPAQIMKKKELIDYIGYHMITTEESKAILDKIPDTQWPNFMDMCKTLQLINKDPSGTIFAIADEIPAAEWANFINVCNEITPFVQQNNKSYAIRAVAKTAYAQWPDLSKTFIAVENGIDLFQRSNALYQLATVPADQYKAIRDYYDLIQPMPGSTDPQQASGTGTDSDFILTLIDTKVLTALEKSPKSPDFWRILKDFARNIMPAYVKSTIIDHLDKIPAEHWQNFVEACNLIVQTNKDLESWKRYIVPSSVSKIKPTFCLILLNLLGIALIFLKNLILVSGQIV